MRGEYEPDTFTKAEVLTALRRAGLHYQDKGRYILSQCPTHDDRHASVQIYTDDWFVNCHATCGRYHITKAFPELRSGSVPIGGGGVRHNTSHSRGDKKKVSEKKYVEYDLMEEWNKMPLIPRNHQFKTIPLEVLDDLGWRWVEEQNAYFIPYFNRPKTKIPFGQYRYLSGDIRFKFLKDAKPTCYGTWNLDPNMAVFVVEGASDASVLEFCMMPWIALPSASSGALMRSFGEWAVANKVQIIYAGDNDAAGDKLLEALDETAPYRVWQPPKKYKDWGDFLVAEGQAAVIAWCDRELNPSADYELTDAQKVIDLLGGTELEVTAPKTEIGSTQELF